MSQNKNDQKIKRPNIFLKLFFSLVILSALGFGTTQFIMARNIEKMETLVSNPNVYNNIFVNNINIGGLSKEEALNKLNTELQEKIEKQNFSVVSNDKKYDYTFKDFNIKYNTKEAVDFAYSYAREGELEERYSKIMNLEEEALKHEIDYTYNSSIIDREINLISSEINTEPKNAILHREGTIFSTTEAIEGTKVNTEPIKKAMANNLDNNLQELINISLESINADYYSDDLKEAQTLLGTFSTSYTGKGTGRGINMSVATSKINNIILNPGETFSTEEAFGPSTYENGYKDAPSIINGKLKDDIGGGVCQVSSILYNAVLLSELEIVERRNHSLPVGYVKLAFDATLAEGYIDLKFLNNTDLPITIEGIMDDSRIYVNVYGKETRANNREIKFENEFVSTNPPGAPKIVYDSNYYEGERITTTHPLNGQTYNLYKTVYEDGKQIDKILINTSVYKARVAEITVGTRISTPVAENIPEPEIPAA